VIIAQWSMVNGHLKQKTHECKDVDVHVDVHVYVYVFVVVSVNVCMRVHTGSVASLMTTGSNLVLATSAPIVFAKSLIAKSAVIRYKYDLCVPKLTTLGKIWLFAHGTPKTSASFVKFEVAASRIE
jgi:hypothetical protein